MQRLIAEYLAEREKGATGITLALLMMLILGFIGVGVDGAAMYAKRQHVQTGADAAAFALAQEYALIGCPSEGVMKSAALPYASANVPNETASTVVDTAVCGVEDGIPYVHVVASAEQPPFFLRAVGAGPVRVPAGATVEWGSPVAGSAFPLTIAQCEFDQALVDAGGVFDGAQIEVWVPSSSNAAPPHCDDGTEFPPSGFGWLDTDGSCEGEYADSETGTWVEGASGNDAVSDCAYPDLVGDTVIVPIFGDSSDQGTFQKYEVVQFASVEIVGIQIQTPIAAYPGKKRFGFAAPNDTMCTIKPAPTSDYKDHCFAGIFRHYVSLDDHWELGPLDPDAETAIIQLKH